MKHLLILLLAFITMSCGCADNHVIDGTKPQPGTMATLKLTHESVMILEPSLNSDYVSIRRSNGDELMVRWYEIE